MKSQRGGPFSLAPATAELAFHALAFVPPPPGGAPLARAASLHRPDYVAFARRHLPRGAVDPCAEDAALLARLMDDEGVATAASLLAILHADVAELRRCATRTLRELSDGDVSTPWARRALLRVAEAPIELLRVAMSLAERDFTRSYAATFGDLQTQLLASLQHAAADLVPTLGALVTADVHLSVPLGPHGRVLGRSIFVGSTSLPGDALDVETPLVATVHELSVQAAEGALRDRGAPAPWAVAERVALLAAARVTRGSSVEAPYDAWAARLETSGLVDARGVPSDVVEEAARRLAEGSA